MIHETSQVDVLGTANAAAARIAATAKQAADDKPGRDAAVRAAAEEFEAVFLSQMLAPMFNQIEPDPVYGGGSGEKVYQSMLVEQYGKALVRRGGVGIADVVEREILRLQEIQK